MSTPLVVPLAWDSQFFGFAVAQVSLPPGAASSLGQLLAQARTHRVRLLYLFLDPADAMGAAAVRQAGGRLVDRKVVLQRPVTGPTPACPLTVQLAGSFNANLEELAWQSGEYSRFRLDPNFASGVFEQLYSQWLRASLAGELARAVWTCHAPDGSPVGLLTLQPGDEAATIGLLAVRDDVRGQGRGQDLLQAALGAVSEWGCPLLRVTTQFDNARAYSFYAAAGFVPVHCEHVYHFWL